MKLTLYLAEETDLDDFILALEKIRDSAEELSTASSPRSAL